MDHPLSIRPARTAALMRALESRILVLDGAMGTMIQRERLTEEQYRGERYKDWPKDLRGNNDLLSITRPAVIRAIHQQYLDAGADILETNTFNATAISMADYGMESLAYELNLESARLAREIADAQSAATPHKPRFVAGVLGPMNRTLSLSPDVNDPGYRAVTFDEVKDAYRYALRGLLDGGADIILVETIFDTLNAKAAIFAIEEEFDARGLEKDHRPPVMISGTITDASGRTLSGQTVAAFWNSVRHVRPLSVGINCALGAVAMRPHIEELAKKYEHGFRHTAIIHSNDLRALTKMGQVMDCTVYVKNGPSSAGIGGIAPVLMPDVPVWEVLAFGALNPAMIVVAFFG